MCLGLELFGVLSMLRQHQSVCRCLLEYVEAQLTVEKLEDLFQVEFTLERCNRQEKEKAVMVNWHLFLLHVRSKPTVIS